MQMSFSGRYRGGKLETFQGYHDIRGLLHTLGQVLYVVLRNRSAFLPNARRGKILDTFWAD